MGRLLSYARLTARFYRSGPGVVVALVVGLLFAMEVWRVWTPSLGMLALLAVQALAGLFLIAYLVGRVRHENERVRAQAAERVAAQIADARRGLEDVEAARHAQFQVLLDELGGRVESIEVQARARATELAELQVQLSEELVTRAQQTAKAEQLQKHLAEVERMRDADARGRAEVNERLHGLGRRVLQLRGALLSNRGEPVGPTD